MTPAWILDALAAAMLAVAAVSAARLAADRPRRPGAVIIDADIAHLLMAVAMAGMLAPSLRTFPNVAWEVICGALIAWFAVRVAGDARATGVRALADGHCAPHLAHSSSMLYMFLAVAPVAGTDGMSGMSGSSGTAMLSYPTLACAFALILVGYTVWDLDQLSGLRYSQRTPQAALAGIGTADGTAAFGVASVTAVVTAPRSAGTGGDFLLSQEVTVGCRIAMGVSMAFVLLTAM